MSSPCTRRMMLLRKRNQDLLAQLESNAAILDARLKNLRETARTPRRSDKSWRNLSQGSLKRKYESWKARNNSGQVSSVLHPVQSPSDISSRPNCHQKINRYCATNADLTTNVHRPTLHDSKLTLPTKECKKLTTTPAVRKSTISSNKRQPPSKPYSNTDCDKVKSSPVKVFSQCYCKRSCKNTSSKHDVSPGQICGKCSCKEFSDFEIVLPDESFSALDSQRRTLEEARNVISYSPESKFLRRLKKRSQINLNAVESPKHPTRGKRIATKAYHRSVSTAKRSPSPKLESNARKSPRLCQKPAACSQTKQPRKPATSNDRKFDVSKKENIKCCSKYVQTSGLDLVAGLVDNEHKAKRLIGENGEGWVDELSEFRRSNWFDCHSHPTNEEQVKHPKMDNDCNCVHRYILNDRLFSVPLNPDHKNQSRCMRCDLPAGAKTKQTPKYPREITLDTARPREQVQVTLAKQPLSRPRDVKPSAGGFKILTSSNDSVKGEPATSASKPMTYKQPKPMNSLALRYQKGII